MATLKVKEEKAILQGQVDILRYTYNFFESMALKCAVELGIADIINSHGQDLVPNYSTNRLTFNISSHVS
ncbi:hypothetical protein CerSpe_125920 [Prunus speciosa]